MKRRGFIKRGALFVPALVGLKRKSEAALVIRLPAAAGGGCNTQEYEQANPSGQFNVGSVSNQTYGASMIDDSELSAFTLCRAEFLILAVGSPTALLTAYLWSNNENGTPTDETDDDPNTLLATSTSTIDTSAVGATEEWHTVDFGDYSVSDSIRFWVGLSSSIVDASNYIRWRYSSTGVAEEIRSSTTPASWSLVSNSRAGCVRLFSS